MIFKNGMHRLALSGQKSEVRRRVKKAERECYYQPGHDYGVKREPKGEELGRIQILAVERQRVGDIAPESVRREGYGSLEQFKEAWLEDNGLKGWDPDREVWAIVFQPFTDEVRIPGSKHVDEHGYVKDPRLAVEGMDESPPAEVVEMFANDNREKFQTLHVEEQARALMRSVLAKARQYGSMELKAGRDPTPMFRALEQQLEGERRREAA